MSIEVTSEVQDLGKLIATEIDDGVRSVTSTTSAKGQFSTNVNGNAAGIRKVGEEIDDLNGKLRLMYGQDDDHSFKYTLVPVRDDDGVLSARVTAEHSFDIPIRSPKPAPPHHEQGDLLDGTEETTQEDLDAEDDALREDASEDGDGNLPPSVPDEEEAADGTDPDAARD